MKEITNDRNTYRTNERTT